MSWNGGGFDLPVLHYRGMLHGVAAPRYWDQGEGDYHDSRDFKWNNYISRYHSRHLDLMDLLASTSRARARRSTTSPKLMGYPGKLGMDGSAVWQAWQEGRIAEIRDYCETDVVNTYLVFASSACAASRRRGVGGGGGRRCAGARPHRRTALEAVPRRLAAGLSGAAPAPSSILVESIAGGHHRNHPHRPDRRSSSRACFIPAGRLRIIMTSLLGIAGSLVAAYGGQALGIYHAGEGAGFPRRGHRRGGDPPSW